MKKTKVVCTIGPASENKEMLTKLINAGMNVMRMNFSHGDHVEQGARIKTVKELNKENNWNVAIMLDTKGPEIRTGYLKNDEPVNLVAGQTIRITMDYSYLGDQNKIAISYPGLYDDIHIGGRILVEDGNISFTVLEKDAANKELVCQVNNSRKLKNKRNCNVPGVILNMPFISEKDYKDVVFGCEQDVDFIAASFVRRAQDILDLRAVLAEQGNTHIKIISKIENQEGVDNMDDIIALSDGIMVARGDLGVDVDTWDLPQIQKEMIYKTQAAGKIVVTATQMLDSMQQNPRPTRAEASDVHNAVLEGTGATMLSGESAQGDFPLEAVTYMAKIDETAEDYIDYDEVLERAIYHSDEDCEHAMLGAAVAKIALDFNVSAIVAEGDTDLALAISRFRPAVDCFMAVKEAKQARTLALAWGVCPVVGSYKDAFAKATSVLELAKGEVIIKVAANKIELVRL